MPEYNPLVTGGFNVARQAAVNDSMGAYSSGQVDKTPICVGTFVLGAAIILFAMQRLGFRAMIGVNA